LYSYQKETFEFRVWQDLDGEKTRFSKDWSPESGSLEVCVLCAHSR
jgi:hypothetical protein